jgi:signal transduction histidine kinase
LAELSRTAEFGRMSQGLFHDLMTPLTSVALYMETLRDIDIPEVQNSRAYVEKAMRASERMGAFMGNIRKGIASRLPENKIDGTVDIGHELAAAVDLLGYKARNAGVRIESDVQAPLFYNGDPADFLQIFLNLISNGIDACENRAGEKIVSIEISAEKDAARDMPRNMRITVSDNGAGIAPKNHAKIFDDFYTTKPAGRGTGLGLSTVKKIVEEKLGGTISFESPEEKGTVFTIVFPAR